MVSNATSIELNTRQELFTMYLFQGMTQRDAYIKVYEPHSSIEDIDSMASRLSSNIKVVDRLSQLKAELKLSSILTVEERKKILAEHAKARLVDFIDETGSPVLTKDTPNNRAASEYETMTRYNRKGEPYTVKRIKIRDPISAISEYNKMEGIGRDNQTNIYVNKVDVNLVRSKVSDLLEGYSKERVIDSTCKELEAPPASNATPESTGNEG